MVEKSSCGTVFPTSSSCPKAPSTTTTPYRGEAVGYARTREFARLFMAPGVGHCAGGPGPQPQGLFDAVVNWVEKGQAPDRILATKAAAGVVTSSRPLCPYPAFARYTGTGSTDDAANFVCRPSFGLDDHDEDDEAGPH